jgi:hypothetical protein
MEFSLTVGGALLAIGTTGTATLASINPNIVKYFQKSKLNNFMVDQSGRVWGDVVLTAGGSGGIVTTGSWTYTGNPIDGSSNGNGLLVFTTVHDGTGGSTVPTRLDEWLFVWRNSQIDYTQLSSAGTLSTITWVSGWNYKLGTINQTGYLNTDIGQNNPHQALVTPDARVNFVDGNYLGNWFQNVPSPGANYVGFNPQVLATYTPQTFTGIMPAFEVGQCLTFVNAFLLIGTKSNFIYPWDLKPSDNTYSTPLIVLPENFTQAMVTVGNNAYIFAGNRGIIYITNGSQASFWKKVPDHISGAVAPNFFWGGSGQTNNRVPTGTATFTKDRLYFGLGAFLQSTGTFATGYGGLWCADINTGALWTINEMSYGTYAGFVTAAMLRAVDNGTNGLGLLIGWNDGTNTPTNGVDASTAIPYTGINQSQIVSDLIPIGTFLQPTTPGQFEFKLSKPLLLGESVELLVGASLDDYANNTFTSLGVTQGTDPPYNLTTNQIVFSNTLPNKIQTQQWLLVKAILRSRVTNPSYVRLTELRVIGATVKDQVATAPFGIR